MILALALLIAAPTSQPIKRITSRKEQMWRLESPHGPLYVFRPGGYRHERGGLVVYVHGLFEDVDTVWREHEIQAQLTASNRNAVFIVPEAPVKPEDFVRWMSLGALIDFVEATLPGVLPNNGPTIAMGHSGAYRTIVEWIDEPRLQEIVLIDGLYGNEDDFATWVKAAPPHRMVISVLTTQKWATPFLAHFPDAPILKVFPKWVWPPAVQTAKVVAITSEQFGHMAQAKGGKVLPVMLRATSLQRRRDTW